MMRDIRNYLCVVVFGAFALGGCGQSGFDYDLSLRSLTAAEAQEDFRAMVSAFTSYYGPMEFKTRHPDVKLDFNKAVKDAEEKLKSTKNDAEIAGVFTEFTSNFRDGHVGVRLPFVDSHEASYQIGIYVFAAKDDKGDWKVVVDQVDTSKFDYPIAPGDVIVSVDGRPAMDYLTEIQKHVRNGNELTDRQLIFMLFNRPYYIPELLPKTPLAKIVYQTPNAGQKEVSAPWIKLSDDKALPELVTPRLGQLMISRNFEIDSSLISLSAPQSSRKRMGSAEPFFFNPTTTAKFGFTRREPSAASLKKYGLDKTTAAPVFALTYENGGKNYLIIRQPGYVPPVGDDVSKDDEAAYRKAIDAWIGTYKAILDENRYVNALIVDQTNNPGGFSSYAMDFFRMLISAPKPGMIQLSNADRRWMDSLTKEAATYDKLNRTLHAQRSRAFIKLIEKAIDAGQPLSEPMTFDYDFEVEPFADFKWNKPVLMLTNELAGSCGDIVPMLVKAAGAAKLFGTRTMGLGGNVETVTLNNSMATLRLTRGLFTSYRSDGDYSKDEIFVENNGVHPDIVREVSVSDVRNSYVDYVQAFTTAASEMK